MKIDEYLSQFIHQDIYILTDEDVKELIRLIELDKQKDWVEYKIPITKSQKDLLKGGSR